MKRKVILLELNEVPAQVLDAYAEAHPDSTFSHLLPRLRRYHTETADEGPLSPWITWPTLHRGVPNTLHGIQHFGEDLREANAKYPPVWTILAGSGVRCGVFGPLQSYPPPSDLGGYSYYLPDTFADSPEAYPAALERFQRFNLVMTGRSPRNVSQGIDLRSGLPFLLSAPFCGLRVSTIIEIGRQLVGELREPWKAVRRRSLQPYIAFDLFEHLLRREKPEFSNFFTNHVASAMHRYWAARFPGDYQEEMGYSPEWIERYKGEIDYAMDYADHFFGRLVDFVDGHPEYLLVVASSMGQQATSPVPCRTQLYLREPNLLLERAGLSRDQWERHPSMDPTVSLSVKAESVERFESFLRSFRIDGNAMAFETKGDGFYNLIFGQPNVPADARVEVGGRRVSLAEVGLVNEEIQDEASSTAYHVSQGVLLIYDPQNPSPPQGDTQTISVLEVAPAILSSFGIPLPDYMRRNPLLTLV